MATGAPNAILAINSLDRYINSKVSTSSTFNAIWTTGQNTITCTTGNPPVIGATLTAAGIPANTVITAVNTVESNLTGSWMEGLSIAFIYSGVPVVGGFLFGQDETLSSVVTAVIPALANNGYGVNLNQVNQVSSGVENSFQATWVIGQNTIQYVSGSRPLVGNAIYAGAFDVFGIVTNVAGNTITFNGLTETNQVAPAQGYSIIPRPVQQTITTVTISQNTTTTQAAQVSVTQRYDITSSAQPVSNALSAAYNDVRPYFYSFEIQSPGALIYGYIQRIVVSQIQVQYNIPTVCKDRNDTLVIATAGPTYTNITIPYGFYTPDELAAVLQGLITADPTLSALNMTVVFDNRTGFTFTSTNATPFYFPDPTPFSEVEVTYKTYRLLGITIANAVPAVSQTSFVYPNFLYTPYIDFYSDVLTNYQNIKDTNTSVAKPKGLIARVYLSGMGNPQTTTSTVALGTAPFIMTADMNSPKIIKWSPDVAVPSIDFQLRDCYGDFVPGQEEGLPTEFQMTLLCVEGGEWRGE
jgi:hypothetical protein